MANHKSALKKYRRDEKKRLVNRMNRTKMRNRVKMFKRKIEAGELAEAKQLFSGVVSIIDKTVKKGTIHPNTGSRYKSRLNHLLRKAEAQP
jgi:small subunit ribosomal protein S20